MLTPAPPVVAIELGIVPCHTVPPSGPRRSRVKPGIGPTDARPVVSSTPAESATTAAPRAKRERRMRTLYACHPEAPVKRRRGSCWGSVDDRDERADRRVRPNRGRSVEGKLDAPEALRRAERCPVERVQRLASVEVADPANAGVVVVRAVGIRAGHRPDRDVLEDRERPGL